MKRPQFLSRLREAFRVHPVVAILGPRQCGKTTLAKQFWKEDGPFHYFDLERPADLARLENPELSLKPLRGTIIIDEIQRKPDLFPLLRVLVDEEDEQRFLILGSASRDLIRQSSETLAGRIRYLELTPFTLEEAGDLPRLWLRGGFPRSYLAPDESASFQWRAAYIATYLERDIPNLGLRVAPAALRRFWMMLAHYHGNLFRASEIGRSLGVSHTTVRHYLDILTGTFMVRELSPWFENIGKRQVKTPKIYFRDSGILHALLGLESETSLQVHPKLGASWEGVALEEVLRVHRADPESTFFWAVHGQGELDLLLFEREKRLGFEFKYTDAPRLTRSMHIARDTLNLDRLSVIYPGKERFLLAKEIEAVGLEAYIGF